MSCRVSVVGGGLAGCEAALVLACHDVAVTLHEMRPGIMTPAHTSGGLAELVCSNSLRSDDPLTGPGLLKEELRALHSPLLALADATRVPAGAALAVDRQRFSAAVAAEVERSSSVSLVRGEVTELPIAGLTLLAPGPLVSARLGAAIAALVGREHLFFFDAIAPIVDADSLDRSKLFAGSRYDEGEGDYLNAALDEAAYLRFVEALVSAHKVVPHGFDALDELPLFSGCEPVEAMAARHQLALAHGPLRPTGLTSAAATRPFAVVQLRPENLARTAYNLVGFQTRLLQPEQRRVLRMIPGLERAEFLRYGSLHRNSYLDSPRLVSQDLSLKVRPDLFVTGQLAGGEGYIESIALGHLAALFALARVRGQEPPIPPAETGLGGLWGHVTQPRSSRLEPSNIHFGLLPPAPGRTRREKRAAAVARAREARARWLPQVSAS